VEPVGDELLYHINESTAVGLRNIALSLWRYCGHFDAACDVLVSLASELFAPYKSNINGIWRQALAEIEFEHFLLQDKWREASVGIDVIRVTDEKEADLRKAELCWKRNNQKDVIKLVQSVLEHSDNSNYLIVRAMILKGKILKNCSVLLKAMDLAKVSKLYGLECLCCIEIAEHLFELEQFSRASDLLRKNMISIFTNGTYRDIGRACFGLARSYYATATAISNATEKTRLLELCLEYNDQAIERLALIGDKYYLTECLVLSTKTHDKLGNPKRRNFFANQLRQLVNCD
jgi:hypothetical protein